MTPPSYLPPDNLFRQAVPRTSPASPVVDYHATFLTFRLAQSAPHLLQVLGQRQCRPCQLDKLHVRAVKALAEYVHIDKNLYLALPEVFDKPFPFVCGCLAVNGDGVHPVLIVISGDIPCVTDAYSVHDAFLAIGILPYALIQPFDTWPPIQHGVHLLHLKITVRSPSFQPVY